MEQIFQFDSTSIRNDYRSLSEIVRQGQITQGDSQRLLIERLKELTDCEHVILTTTGTAAIHTVLRATDNDGIANEVIIPSYISDSVLIALRWAKTEPRFVDMSNQNFTIDISKINHAITDKTRAAIIPYGFGDYISFTELMERNILIIEDICHCTGGRINGKRLGSFGHVGITSFGECKYLDGGFGGAIFTNDASIARQIENLTGEFQFQPNLQAHYFMPNIFANIIYNNSFFIDEEIVKRRAIAEIYIERFRNFDIEILQTDLDKSFYHRFMIGVKNKNEFLKKIRAEGIMASNGIRTPLHISTQLNISLPETERYWNNFVAIPIRPSLRSHEVERIVSTVIRCL